VGEDVPEGTARTVLGDVPDGVGLVDDVVDLQDVLVLHLPQFLVDLLLLRDVLRVGQAFLHPPHCQVLLQLRVEHPEYLRPLTATYAKVPFPTSYAFPRSNSRFKYGDLILIKILYSKANGRPSRISFSGKLGQRPCTSLGIEII
jgi:hypothetical protein